MLNIELTVCGKASLGLRTDLVSAVTELNACNLARNPPTPEFALTAC